MKKIDRRVARTRKALADALISLTKEKDYDQITIRDLTERADVGYATFYRHYKSKDELLSQFVRRVAQDVWDQIKPEMSPYEEALAMFKALEPHRDGILLGLSFPREHPVMKPAWDDVMDKVLALYAAKDESAIPLDVSVNHLMNSVVELIRWWLVEGQDYSPEQMATIQSELIFKVTESVALDNQYR